MKSTLLTLLLVIFSINAKASSIYCCCFGYGLYDVNLTEKVEEFMQAKLLVEARDILEIKVIESENFIPVTLKPLLSLSLIGLNAEERKEMRECEESCTKMNFEKNIYEVVFHKNGQTCSQVLYLTAKKNVITETVKTTIKKKTYPTCN